MRDDLGDVLRRVRVHVRRVDAERGHVVEERGGEAVGDAVDRDAGRPWPRR